MQVSEQLERALAPYGVSAADFLAKNPTFAKGVEDACLTGAVAGGKELR